MSRDVFISHSSEDRDLAQRICRSLEEQGVACWIAPRDILGGESYGSEILNAIEECQILLLLFSEHANHSDPVFNEVERAAHYKKRILPFRVEEVLPSRKLEFFLSSPHWLDAYNGPMESHLDRLVHHTRTLLDRLRSGDAIHSDEDESLSFDPPPGAQPSQKVGKSALQRYEMSTFDTLCNVGLTFCWLLVVWTAIAIVPLYFIAGLQKGAYIAIGSGALYALSLAPLLRGDSRSLTYEDEEEFLHRLNIEMSSLAFVPVERAKGFYTYRPTLRVGLMSGNITVHFKNGDATIVGPSLHLKKLVQRLRDRE